MLKVKRVMMIRDLCKMFNFVWIYSGVSKAFNFNATTSFPAIFKTNKRASRRDNMKYNKKMFLEYASAFDYTEDFHYSAEQSGKPITWEQAKKQNDEYMKSMENWSLKDFQEHFNFRKFDIDENEQASEQKG